MLAYIYIYHTWILWVWHDMIWCDMMWYDVIWCDMIYYLCTNIEITLNNWTCQTWCLLCLLIALYKLSFYWILLGWMAIRPHKYQESKRAATIHPRDSMQQRTQSLPRLFQTWSSTWSSTFKAFCCNTTSRTSGHVTSFRFIFIVAQLDDGLDPEVGQNGVWCPWTNQATSISNQQQYLWGFP